MIKTIGHARKLRTAVIAGACTMALAGAAGTATAATAATAHAGTVRPENSSPNLYGPNTATLNWFCGKFKLWKVNATFDGTNNAGGRDEWVVQSVVDSTGDTAFGGENDFGQFVKWYCG